MFEVVEAVSRDGGEYFDRYTEAVEWALGGEPGVRYEVWQVADDERRTRVLLMGSHRVPDCV